MIILVCGPMFSGKTSFLLSYERKSNIAQKKICYIKHSNDTRYTTESSVINHDGQSSSTMVFNTNSCMNVSSYIDFYDVILIDEGQFFNDLSIFCEKFGENKTIVISALSGDYKMNMFSPIIDIFSKVDKIIHTTAICTTCGEDAPFTKRLIESGEQVVIGGKESYSPKCRKCMKL